MDKIWNMTIDFLAKVNNWIPLVTVLWAGLGLIGIVLALAITGYVLRKRLVQQWLIWTYFIGATIIIFAQANGDLFTVVAHMEVPCLVVLVCYLLRLVFYRRPRYTYMERTVCVREIDNTPIVKEVKVKDVKEDNNAREVETTVVEEVKASEITFADALNEKQEDNKEEEKEVEKEEATFESFFDEKSEEKSEEKVEDKNEDTVAEEKTEKTEEKAAVDMPVVEPIPEKTYEAPREPGIVTSPVSETIPELKPTLAASRPSTMVTRSTSTSSLTSASRPASTLTSRPSTTTSSTLANRTATATTSTSSTAARPSSFTSMYKPSVVKTTTTTTTTTTTNSNASANTLNASSTVRSTSGLTTGLNRTATTATSTSATKNPRSTDDIMAAIARLRASMKK